MAELKEVIKYVYDSLDNELISPTDDAILDLAGKIYISDRIQDEKRGFKTADQVDKSKPTDSQINFLKKRKIDTASITRIEATKLIGEIINKEKSKKKDKYTEY